VVLVEAYYPGIGFGFSIWQREHTHTYLTYLPTYGSGEHSAAISMSSFDDAEDSHGAILLLPPAISCTTRNELDGSGPYATVTGIFALLPPW
jgi:hypothetical protein